MKTRHITGRIVAVSALALAVSPSMPADAATLACPYIAGGGPEYVEAGYNAPADCWTAPAGCGTEQQCWLVGTTMARGTIEVGPTGGVSRKVGAYNFSTGGHDFARSSGFDLFDDPTCTATDTSKNGSWTWNEANPGCVGTAYAVVTAWLN